MHTDDALRTPAGPLLEGPDFLCIGMSKAGTGWLYLQLRYHPDFWMPPIKELHYLDREAPKVSKAKRLLSRHTEFSARRLEKMKIGKSEIQFAEEMRAVHGEPMNLDFYASIFRFKENLISGDVSPSYCAMPEELIAKIMTRFPKLKIIFLLRDPVSRAWSHLTMLHRGGKVNADDLQDIVKFRALFETSRTLRTGLPATFTRRWLKYVPAAQFHHYFFEDLLSDPEGLKRKVLTFLGADPMKAGLLDPSENKKEKPKLQMPSDIRDFLIQSFFDELIASAAIFGGHATTWSAKYGIDSSARRSE